VTALPASGNVGGPPGSHGHPGRQGSHSSGGTAIPVPSQRISISTSHSHNGKDSNGGNMTPTPPTTAAPTTPASRNGNGIDDFASLFGAPSPVSTSHTNTPPVTAAPRTGMRSLLSL
jgi:hypothetical protein